MDETVMFSKEELNQIIEQIIEQEAHHDRRIHAN